MSTAHQQGAMESTPSYPASAYLCFCPGGISYSKRRASKEDWYELASYSHTSNSSFGGAQTPRSTPPRRALSPDALVTKARDADDRLRQYTLLYGKDTALPHFLPSLSVLAEAAFGPLTGVPAASARKWADAMVLNYLDNDGTQEAIPSNEEECSSFDVSVKASANETVVSVLKRLLEDAKRNQGSADAGDYSPHGGARNRPCGYVFQRGDIAWNCRTCQTDSTCVLCDTCFRNSNHEGHEVFFHRTTPGGCCDCGDAEAWKVDGCCLQHRPQDSEKRPSQEHLDPTEEAVRIAVRGRKDAVETLTSEPTALPPRMAAALGVVVGAAVQCLVNAVDGAGIGADPIQWKLKWADEAARVVNGAPHDSDYVNKTAPFATPLTVTGGADHPVSLPQGYRLHLRLHNDDVHTFDEVISALYESRSSRRNSSGEQSLVNHREEADDLTHHVDADGQVVVKACTSIASALQGYRRLKSGGLHCAVVGTSQVDLELRARALSSWLAEISAAHPSVAALVVHALVQVSSQDQEIAGVYVWNKARMIPSWSGLVDDNDELQSCRQKFHAFPPHLASSYLTREEAERLHQLGLEMDAAGFVGLTGTDTNFYSNVPYRLPSGRYCKSPHALWGTLPSNYSDNSTPSSKHPLLHRLGPGENEASKGMGNMLTEDVVIVDTDLRKQQEAERITSSVYPHKLPGLNMISGIGTISMRSLSSSPPPEPSPMQWRHLLSTCSFRAPVSPILILLLLDPYPTKQLRANLHALFLSLLVDARFKCRFAAALGGVAYRPLSTLFCAGVGTEADSLLGFTVQIFTAGSLVRALGSSSATGKLLMSDREAEKAVGGSSVGTFSLPIAHTIVRCIHTNLLGATKEVHMILNNTAAGNHDDTQEEAGNDNLLPALTYCAGEHPLATQLPAAPDDGFLDSRSTRHKRLPHLLRDLEYVIETPGTGVRLLLPQRFPIHPLLPSSGRMEDAISFPTVWSRLLRLAQGMDPQKRKIAGGHVEYEQNRWLEAFGLSLNFAGTRDALAESPTNASSAVYAPVSSDGSHLVIIREAMGNLFAALLRELKLWLYREGMLETGLPSPPLAAHGGMDLSPVEALQRSTLHVSSSQLGISPATEDYSDIGTSGGSKNVVALSCATGVKMTEAQLGLIESALRMEETQHQHRLASTELGGVSDSGRSGPVMGDWLRVPHSPLAGDSLSFHLPLHRALAKSVRSLCSVVVPEAVRTTHPTSWWKLPILDEEFGAASFDPNGPRQHPLIVLLRPTLRSSNCRVVWSSGPECTSSEAQKRRSRAKSVSAAIASAKIIHTIADHPIRCLAAAQQIERHLWARNGSSTAGMALNYSSAPLCRSFRDLDLTLVQLSAAGLSIGLGVRRVFSLLISRFSMDGYLCDPERRPQSGSSNATSGGGTPSYGAGVWVNPPRLQDPEHAIALSESFFTTLCVLVTELPAPPPLSPSDDTALKSSIKRELLHALAAEPRSHSEAMSAASSAVSRRDDSDSSAGSGGGGGVFREVFAEVLRDIGKQKSQGNSRAASGPAAFELRAEYCYEYDPTFFHLRRQEHQHAMDNVARLRRQKTGGAMKGSGNIDTRCLPVVCSPPKAHPRFLSCRLLLHLEGMDAAMRRALLFALTGGSWLPPSEPVPLPGDNVDVGPTANEGRVVTTRGLAAGSSGVAPPVPLTTFGRRSFKRSSSSSFAKRSFNENDESPPFSPATVAASSISFLEVLQLLTLQVHTLEECASLHRTHVDLDDEAKFLSSGLSINSYLRRLIHVPDSLLDVWALRPFPEGPLPSKGSGESRGSILGLLIALYEHRADHEGNDFSAGSTDAADDGHGGARTLAASGLKWLLRFVNSLVDGAPSVSIACQCAASGNPFLAASVSSAAPGSSDAVNWTISESIRSSISAMLSDVPDLWPKDEDKSHSKETEKPNNKSKEARKAAQLRVMEMMKRKQNAFAQTIASHDSNVEKIDVDEEDEKDLCIICRCDDADGENNGPLGYLGHVQRSRTAHLRLSQEASCRKFGDPGRNELFCTYRVVGDRGCQLRETERMDSTPLACLPMGSIVTVLKSKVSEKYGLLSRRVLVRHDPKDGLGDGKVTEGWASVQSSQGYIILSPLSSLCFSNTRWGTTRPFIRQCGHAAHLQCVEAHTLSLHQRAAGEQPYDGRFAANIDDGEFLCPLCKQLSNILIPRHLCASGSSETTDASDSPPGSNSACGSSEKQSLTKLLSYSTNQSQRISTDANNIGKKALEQFGAHLLQAMAVPWERTTATQKKDQRRWPTLLKRWDFEEEEGDLSASCSTGPCVGQSLRLLRQQHIAWAAVGHSAASAEASTRGIEESLPFGTFARTSDPWTDFTAKNRDSHPQLLEMKRTLTATSGLFELLVAEMNKQIGSSTASRKTNAVSVVGLCLAAILEGRSWTLDPDKNSASNDMCMQWSALTALVSSVPCHTARDGMISPRHEARAVAASMWAVKGLGTNYPNTATDDTAALSNPPAPLAIQQISSRATHSPILPPLWGTMDPFLAIDTSENNVSLNPPFRPGISSAFLYVPLLAWDMNTLAGATFSTMLANYSDNLPSSEELLQTTRLLLVGRMVQVIVTPCGYHESSSIEDDEDHWTQKQRENEESSLKRIVAICEATLKCRSSSDSGLAAKSVDGALHNDLFSAIGQAILPFARSLILLLRACTSAILQRRRKQSQEQLTADDKLLDSLLFNPEAMETEDGFLIVKLLGGPLPSNLVNESSSQGSFPWSTIIDRWLLCVRGLELHHGSRGKSILPQIASAQSLEEGATSSINNFVQTSMDMDAVQSEACESQAALGESELEATNLSMSVASEDNEDAEGFEEDIDMEGVGIEPNIGFLNGNDLLAGGDDLDDSDDDMMDDMEVDIEDETMGFFEQAVADVSGTRRRHIASNDVFDDSSEEKAISDSGLNQWHRLDKTYAYVSQSPILPYQPSLLGMEEIGPGPRGASFEFSSASALMCDLSHLGMIHQKGTPTQSLIRLPHSFVELYSLVNRVKGRNGPGTRDDGDDAGISETALCLLTGTVMRSGSSHRRSYSRASRPPGTCTLHARKVGSGTGIFFLVQKCKVLLMHNNKSAYSASLFVDEHGEEDPGLRRGRPLFLNEARYRALELLWRQQGIPREVAQIRSTSDRVIRDNWY